MARAQQIFKLDKREIEDTLALALALKDSPKVDYISQFCKDFAIPLDAVNIKMQQERYEKVAKIVRDNLPAKK